MIEKILKKNKAVSYSASLLLFVLFPILAWAQSSLTLGISTTLINVSLEPGQAWGSSLRIINPNPYQLKVFVDVVDFYSQGEDGGGYFVSANSDKNNKTLANWIDLKEKSIIIPAGQVKELSFRVNIPNDAPPGGHFAAILVGTKPPVDKKSVKVNTSQITTSLLFLQVNGDIKEEGRIRSFSTAQKVTDVAKVDFSLRFENTGNIHLLPRGEIKIVDWKGSTVGVLPINQDTDFGNVLPNTIRKYDLSWKKDRPDSFWNIGYYRATVSLGYGKDEKKFDFSKISFWIIPWKKIVVGISVFLFLTWLIVFLIKIYIRKILKAAGISPHQVNGSILNKHNLKKVSMVSPLKSEILDLRKHFKTRKNIQIDNSVSGHNSNQYYLLKIIFGAAILLIIILLLIYLLKDSNVKEAENKTPVSHAPTAMGEIFKTDSAIDDEKDIDKNNATATSYSSTPNTESGFKNH